MPDIRPHYFLPAWIEPTDRTIDVDVCVYGGTASGAIAAAAATRKGKSALILNPATHLGGMTTGGLGWTDFGKKHVIGGMARQFYRDLGALHGREEIWRFAPSDAQRVIDGYVKDAGVDVHARQFLDSVKIDDGRITAIRMISGLTVTARMFIDATYEGDLLARAGVSYHVGREANSVYGETINGVQIRDKHQFSSPIDPFVKPGDPSSGTLPFINFQDAATEGSGDTRIQAYNFRVCMTDDPKLRVDWEQPDGYDDRQFELARRWYNAEKDAYNEAIVEPGLIMKMDVLDIRTPDGFGKTDTNNHGPMSSDNIGANYLWPDADYMLRERIFQAHVTYQKSLYWCLANDPQIPDRYREAYRRWGLAGDEFKDSGHWPHQLYVREARRMVGDYVVHEHDTQHKRKCDDPVAMGSYNMDSHNCQRFVRVDEATGKPRVLNEGDVQLAPAGPYGISYRAIVPKRGECRNLLVPVCMSSSHIAFGSVRMEPVFMALGESAACAASQAIDTGCDVQAVKYATLRSALDEADQVLEV